MQKTHVYICHSKCNFLKSSPCTIKIYEIHSSISFFFILNKYANNLSFYFFIITHRKKKLNIFLRHTHSQVVRMRATTEITVLRLAIGTVWMDGVTSWMERVLVVFKDTQDRCVIQVGIQHLKKIMCTKNTTIYDDYHVFNNLIYL